MQDIVESFVFPSEKNEQVAKNERVDLMNCFAASVPDRQHKPNRHTLTHEEHALTSEQTPSQMPSLSTTPPKKEKKKKHTIGIQSKAHISGAFRSMQPSSNYGQIAPNNVAVQNMFSDRSFLCAKPKHVTASARTQRLSS